jgi:hypothetical protein
LTSLPKGLKVEMHLYIKNTPLAELSYSTIVNMIKPGYIKKCMKTH